MAWFEYRVIALIDVKTRNRKRFSSSLYMFYFNALDRLIFHSSLSGLDLLDLSQESCSIIGCKSASTILPYHTWHKYLCTEIGHATPQVNEMETEVT